MTFFIKIAVRLLFGWMILGLPAYSQTSSFTVKSPVCKFEKIRLTNTSSGAASYKWDFCNGDLDSIITTSSVPKVIGDADFPIDAQMLFGEGSWYGFVVDFLSSKMYRLEYGVSLKQSPTIIDMGTLGVLDFPTQARFIKGNNVWYGFVTNYSGNQLVRLTFGNGIDSLPTAKENLGAFSSLSAPFGLEILNDGGDYTIIVSNSTSNKLSLIHFGTSLLNNPDDTDVIETGGAVGFSGLGRISIKNYNGKWYGLINSVNDSKVYRMNLGTVVFDAINSFDLIGVITNPEGTELVEEGGNYFGFIASRTNGIYKIDFKNDIGGNGTIAFLGKFGITDEFRSISLTRDSPGWRLFSLSRNGATLSRIDFDDRCTGTVLETSTLAEPTQAYYSKAGQYKIELSILSSTGNIATAAKTILVKNLPVPIFDFSTTSNCVNNAGFFSTTSSSNLISYSWDFNNDNIEDSNSNNPSYTFSGSGENSVKVTAADSFGCQNTVQKTISIYNPPVASFDNPLGVLCSYSQYLFVNTVNDTYNGKLSYHWFIDNSLQATSRDLSFLFSSVGNRDIRLRTAIPGCFSETSQTFAVSQIGPFVDFNLLPNGCQNTSQSLVNTTLGAVTSYSWAFGDGNTSTSTDGINTYTNTGNFNITLQATNAAGCQNSATKAITIYSKPQPNFSIGLPPFSCSGSPSQFTDLTPLPTDSNIASWTWGFGDTANGLGILKNPTYTYSASGNYNVSLAIATNFGCSNSIQKSVTVAQSPVAGYSNLPACANQLTQFTDTSTGSIKSRLWQLGINTFTIPNPQFSFSSSGSFPVTLTITGNNNCVSQISKNINVPIPPSLDFSVEVPCTNSSTLFREITNSADPSISQSWAFGTVASGSGSPAQNIFASPGNFAVRLSSTRQSGCVYSISKSVAIVNSPVADFSPSTDAGAAPLGVLFANQSTFASSYLWKFRDSNNLTSSLANPFFVFTDLGDYDVELTASNSVGCSSKANKIISVVIPRIDAVMTDFYFIKDPLTNSLQPVIKVLNKSNVSIVDPSILIDVAGSSVIQKKIIGIVRPNQELTQTLDFQIVPRTNYYVCAEVQVAGDTDLFLNRKCLSLSNDEILFTPFPNPAQAELYLDWISVNGDPVDFQIVTRAGSVCLQQTVDNVVKGINRLVVNTSALPAGIYYIRYRDSKLSKTFSFVVSGN